MELPFTTEQFFKVIEKYNVTVFPFQLIILLAGILCLYLIHTKLSVKSKFTGSFLGLLWIWTGIAYHLAFFTVINKAAFGFGIIFILQGLLILICTFRKSRLVFTLTSHTSTYFGYFFIAYGLIIYPIISYWVEGSAGRTIILGLPCPSTIFTFGFFMLTSNRFPNYLLLIPTLWAVVGLSAALHIGVLQDLMIAIAALTADVLLLSRKKTTKVKTALSSQIRPDRGFEIRKD